MKFKNTTSMKLDFGDYAVSGDHYDYTYVDRKSESDFKSTMTSGFDRFKREMDRAKEFDSYLFVVIESTIEKVIENNKKNSYAANLPYLWHNVRLMTHEYKGTCQFVFSGGREESKKIIPKLLVQGRKLGYRLTILYRQIMTWEEGTQEFKNPDENYNEKLLELKGYLEEKDAKYELYKFQGII